MGVEETPFVTLIHEIEGVPVVKVSGSLDLMSAGRFREALEQAISPVLRSAACEPEVVVDLSAVAFMDSAGINALVGAARRLGEGGGQVRLVVKDSPAARTLGITGLDRRFAVYPDVGSAIKGEMR